MPKPSKRKQDLEALEALKREAENDREQRVSANIAYINGISMAIERLKELDVENEISRT